MSILAILVLFLFGEYIVAMVIGAIAFIVLFYVLGSAPDFVWVSASLIISSSLFYVVIYDLKKKYNEKKNAV